MIRKNKRVILAALITLFVTLGLLWLIGKPTESQSPKTENNQDHGLTFSDFYRQIRAGGENIEKLITNGLIQRDPGASAATLNPDIIKDQYTRTDLKLIPDNKKNLYDYGLALASTLKPFEAKRDNEARLMLAIMDSENLNDLAKLARSARLYKEVAKRLSVMSVPEGVVPLHLKLLNNTDLLAKLISNMAEVLEEPLLALESAAEYQRQSSTFFGAIVALNAYFFNNGVLFDDTESIKIYVNLEI